MPFGRTIVVAHMTKIESRLPHPLLLPYVKRYFWGRDENPPLAQRIVPNGEMGLLFFRESTVTMDGCQNMRACFKGQSMRYHDIVSQKGIEIVGVHFTMLGARSFIDFPLHELFETTLEIADMDDTEWKILEYQVFEAPTYQSCWLLLDDFFLRRLTKSKVDKHNTKRLYHAISQSKRLTRVSDLSAKACLSPRQFQRLFTDQIGLSPKDFLRLQRYQTTLQELKLFRHHHSLSEIVWRNGYYDLRHLSNDFKQFTGFCPSALLKVSKNEHDVVGWRL